MFSLSFKQVSSVICALILTLTLCLGTVGHASAQGVNAGGAGGGGSAGGGGGTGGGGGGGAVSCVNLTQLSNTVGYYSSYAAIWTKQSFTETCGGVTWTLDYRNVATGSIEHSTGGLSRSSYNGTIDDDFAPFSTSYNLTLTITDSRGVVQLVQNTAATTPAARVPGA